MEISFQCGACGGKEKFRPERLMPAWARLWGFESCVEWLGSGARPRGGSGPELGPRREALPAAGESCCLVVRHPFRADDNHPFWALFQPALSHFNGWEEHPEELERSGLVRCRLAADLGPDGAGRAAAGGPGTLDSRSLEVRVLDSLLLTDLAGRFPSTGEGTLPEIHDSRRRRVEHGGLVQLSWNGEGDVGGWTMFQRRAAGWAVILCCEWGWHESFVFAGHRPASGDELSKHGLKP